MGGDGVLAGGSCAVAGWWSQPGGDGGAVSGGRRGGLQRCVGVGPKGRPGLS